MTIDNTYENAFKQVYDILKNTEKELVDKLPKSLIKFFYDQMNKEYNSNINTEIDIDKQKLLPKTEAILALIYKNYWNENTEVNNISNNNETIKTNNPQNNTENTKIINNSNYNEKTENAQTSESIAILNKQGFFAKIIMFLRKKISWLK